MPSPGLPTNVAAGQTGHVGHTNTVHGLLNKFDSGIGTSSTGNVLAWNGSVYAPATTGYANVLDYGAVDSALLTDSTTDTANTTAFTNAAATGKPVLVPAGVYYGSYNLDVSTNPNFVGLGPATSQIKIAAGQHFLDANRIWGSLQVHGIQFVGGKGAIRNRYTGSNVTQIHSVSDCMFEQYTGCAVSTNSSDLPLVKIERCNFYAANDSGTIGIALNGLTDTNHIHDCEFQGNQVHIKLGYGGNNCYISHNDFVQYRAGTGGVARMMIWVVPWSSTVNAGSGFLVDACKFGNENLSADDKRIVYADEGSGTYFGDRLPVLTADSTGNITGHRIRDCHFVGAGGFGSGHPIVYTTTVAMQGCYIGPAMLAGWEPSYAIEFRTGTATPTSAYSDNLVGPFQYRTTGGVTCAGTNRAGRAVLINIGNFVIT